jgi:ribonucleoside-diphosphate reductase subunit M2
MSEQKQDTKTLGDRLEPICDPKCQKTILPYDPKFDDVRKLYNRQQSALWVVNDIDFTKDNFYFEKMPDPLKHALIRILGFFAVSDELVCDNIDKYFSQEIANRLILQLYATQRYVEGVHAETYGANLIAICPDSYNEVFHMFETDDIIKMKADYVTKWMASDTSFASRCVAFACIEGILFSSSFAFIDWLKYENYQLKGTFFANDYISADEGEHMRSGFIIYGHLVNKLQKVEVKKIIDGALAIEIAFVNSIIPEEGFDGLNRKMMIEQVTHHGNIVGNGMGFKNLYGETKGLPFMLSRSLDPKANFFENKSNQYKSQNATQEDGDNDFDLNADF